MHGLRVRTLLLHKQVALHGVVADALVFVRVLLHLPHQRLHLRPRALKTVPRLRAQSQEKKKVDPETGSDVSITRNLCILHPRVWNS